MKFVIAAAAIASVNAECFEGIKMQAYEDKECTKAMKGQEEVKIDAAQATEMNKKCHPLPKGAEADKMAGVDVDATALNVKCDTSTVTVNLFEKEDCSSDPEAHTQKWGECKKYEMGPMTVYVKMTGALALQATAAAALATIGSQF